MYRVLQRWYHRRKYQEGKTISRFIARDVRRDALIVSVSRIDEGILTAKIRTTNILYQVRGLVKEADYSPVQDIRIEDLWDWTGKSFGGLPNGTSILEKE